MTPRLVTYTPTTPAPPMIGGYTLDQIAQARDLLDRLIAVSPSQDFIDHAYPTAGYLDTLIAHLAQEATG